MLYLFSSSDLAQPVSPVDRKFQQCVDLALFKQHRLG
jgi:hypothetical protein